MRNTLKIICLLFIVSTYDCMPARNIENGGKNSASTNALKLSKEMTEKGFSKGFITISKFEGCPYILNVEEFKDNLDPINIGEFFKGEIPEYVWVKFSSLRMPSRCSEARPVSITEITKRQKS